MSAKNILFHLPEIPPLKKRPLQRERQSESSKNLPASLDDPSSSLYQESTENQTNVRSSSLSYSPKISISASKQPPPRRHVLRNLETMETFFRCNSHSSSEYVALCRKVTEHPSNFLPLEEEAKAWRRILEMQSQQVALEMQQQHGLTVKSARRNGHSTNSPEADLLRMHRRATSRFSNALSSPIDKQKRSFQLDLLSIYLSLAQAQLQYGSEKDARQTLKYLQNEPFGATEAAVYLALARIDGEDAESMLRMGIQKNAEPIQDLHNALRDLRASPKRRKIGDFQHQTYIHGGEEDNFDEISNQQKNTSQLSQDSNMSLDESEEDDDLTEKAPKKSIQFHLAPTTLRRSQQTVASGKSLSLATKTSILTDQNLIASNNAVKSTKELVTVPKNTDETVLGTFIFK